MVSASRKRAAAAMKEKLVASRKAKAAQNEMAGPWVCAQNAQQVPMPTTNEFGSFKNAEGQTVMWYINPLGKKIYQTEAPLPAAWPIPEGKQHIKRDESGEVISVLKSGYVTARGQQIRESLGKAFLWDGEEPDARSIYNCDEPGNPFHAIWLESQKASKDYAPTVVPLNLQQAEEEGFDFSDPCAGDEDEAQIKSQGKKECSFWARGTCKNGPSCKFLHSPDKAPKGLDAEAVKAMTYGSKECAYYPQGLCKNGDSCKFLHSPGKAPKGCKELDAEAVKAKTYGAKECAYWPQGLCKNGGSCKFLHPSKKAPKARSSNASSNASSNGR